MYMRLCVRSGYPAPVGDGSGRSSAALRPEGENTGPDSRKLHLLTNVETAPVLTRKGVRE